ncbi:MAG: hypothetical protein AB1452_17425 [Pseudomonadota bacterium]
MPQRIRTSLASAPGFAAAFGFGALVACDAVLLGGAWLSFALAHSWPSGGNWPTFSRALAEGGARDGQLAAIAGAGLFVGALALAAARMQQARSAVAGRGVLRLMALIAALAAALGIVHYFHVTITLAVDNRLHMLLSYGFFFGMSAVIVADLYCNLRVARIEPRAAGRYTRVHRAAGFGVLGCSAVFLLTFLLKDAAGNPWSVGTQRIFVLAEFAWIVLAHAYALMYVPVTQAHFRARPPAVAAAARGAKAWN